MTYIFSIFIASILIFIGYIANYLFNSKKIPETAILIPIGILIGPVLHLIDVNSISNIAPLFSIIALGIILFEGGLNLELLETIKTLPYAFLLAITNAFFSILFTTIICHLFLGWDIIYGLLLGSIMSGISGPIVISLLSGLNIDEKIKAILSVESSFTDTLTVILSLTILNFILLNQVNFEKAAQNIAATYSVGFVLGLISGIIWMSILRRLKGKFSYMLTLSYIFLVYSITEYLGGNGAIASLIMGIVLGNTKEIIKMFKMGETFSLGRTIIKFHEEITFFIKTFFFIYLGLLFSFEFFNIHFLLISLIILLFLLLSRIISSNILYKIGIKEKNILSSVIARGLGAAVVATIPLEHNIKFAKEISVYTSFLIILTNLITAFLIWEFAKQNKRNNKNSAKA